MASLKRMWASGSALGTHREGARQSPLVIAYRGRTIIALNIEVTICCPAKGPGSASGKTGTFPFRTT